MPNPMEDKEFTEFVSAMIEAPLTKVEDVDDTTHSWSKIPVHQTTEVEKQEDQSDYKYALSCIAQGIKDTVGKTTPPRPLEGWNVCALTNQIMLLYPKAETKKPKCVKCDQDRKMGMVIYTDPLQAEWNCEQCDTKEVFSEELYPISR